MFAGNLKIKRALIAAFLLTSLAGIWPTPSAVGQSSAASKSQNLDPGGSSTFRPVSGPERDQVPGGGLLIVAYGVVWLLLLAYVVRIGRIQTKMQGDLQRLERELASVEESAQRQADKKRNT
jgi:CcmD family protein